MINAITVRRPQPPNRSGRCELRHGNRQITTSTSGPRPFVPHAGDRSPSLPIYLHQSQRRDQAASRKYFKGADVLVIEMNHRSSRSIRLTRFTQQDRHHAIRASGRKDLAGTAVNNHGGTLTGGSDKAPRRHHRPGTPAWDHQTRGAERVQCGPWLSTTGIESLQPPRTALMTPPQRAHPPCRHARTRQRD